MESILQSCESRVQADRPQLAVGGIAAWLWAAIVLAMLLRVGLAAASIGTNDAFTFVHFAREVGHVGVVKLYGLEGGFNHPPLIGWWTALLMRTVAPSLPPDVACPPRVGWLFCFLFKLPLIAADGLAAWVLWRLWTPTLGSAKALGVAAAFAWSPNAILLSAFHGNTDPMYVALALAAVCLMESRGAFFCSGLALAGAINTKIIPVLLILPLLLSCPGVPQARRFLYGMALGAMPFLPVVLSDFPSFYSNALAYNSMVDRWGIESFLLLARDIPRFSQWAEHAVGCYYQWGRYVLLGLIVAWAAATRIHKQWDRYELAAVTMALFEVFTPGFGAQYTAAAGLLLFAVRPRLGAAYGLAAGAFLLILYLARSNLSLPLAAVFNGPLTRTESVFGLAVWGLLVYFLIQVVFFSSNRDLG